MIYFYKATGRVTGDMYYYMSMKSDESIPSNCFPIAEAIKDFSAIDRESIVESATLYGLEDPDKTGFRKSIPCTNKDMVEKYCAGEINTDNTEVRLEDGVGLSEVLDMLHDRHCKN